MKMCEESQILVRCVNLEDAEQIAEIYRYYVENTAITFECISPTKKEFAERIRKITEKYPFLVAEQGSRIFGYCYASELKSREAFKWSVETSIYLEHGCQGKGIGGMLYAELEKRLSAQGIVTLYACIASCEKDDDRLNTASITFHNRMGYSYCGKFSDCASKFGKWYSVVWMEKKIGECKDNPTQPNFTRQFKA